MSAVIVDHMDAINHLPAGGTLTLCEIDWDEYEQLLEQLSNHGNLRLNYNQGRLEIMSPSAKHEKYKNLLHDLVVILGDELEQDVFSYGSVTLKLKSGNRGAEGDDCFYIQHASQVAGKDRLDLTFDPPPDLLIEIDLSSESSTKFAIYSAVGAPETWRYDGINWQIWTLQGQDYKLAAHSLAFDFLNADQIAEFIVQSETDGPYKARRAFIAAIKDSRRSST